MPRNHVSRSVHLQYLHTLRNAAIQGLNMSRLINTILVKSKNLVCCILFCWTVALFADDKSLCITIQYKLLTDRGDVTSELYVYMIFEVNSLLGHGSDQSACVSDWFVCIFPLQALVLHRMEYLYIHCTACTRFGTTPVKGLSSPHDLTTLLPWSSTHLKCAA